jgi:hypothetical protein
MPSKSFKPRKLGSHIDEGWAPDTHPIYSSGWNFLSGKNLNPRFKKQSTAAEQPEPQGQSDPERKPEE